MSLLAAFSSWMTQDSSHAKVTDLPDDEVAIPNHDPLLDQFVELERSVRAREEQEERERQAAARKAIQDSCVHEWKAIERPQTSGMVMLSTAMLDRSWLATLSPKTTTRCSKCGLEV